MKLATFVRLIVLMFLVVTVMFVALSTTGPTSEKPLPNESVPTQKAYGQRTPAFQWSGYQSTFG